MKIKNWLMAVPALLVAASANAAEVNWLCVLFKINCAPSGGGDGGGPVSVPEPGQLALFGAGLLICAVFAFRRSRQQN